MNTASSRLRTIAIATAAAAATVVVSGFVPTGAADAQSHDQLTQCVNQLQQKDYRIQRVKTRAQNYKAAYEELSRAMVRMENVASRRVMDHRTRARLVNMGSSARRRAANHLQQRHHQPPPVVVAPPPVVVAPPPTIVTPPPPQPVSYGPNPISHGGFRRFHDAVRRANFDRDRVALVRDMSRRVAFNARQITALMRLCSFDKSRVEVAVALHHNVMDPQNWFQVYGALSFSSSKQKLRRRIRRHR